MQVARVDIVILTDLSSIPSGILFGSNLNTKDYFIQFYGRKASLNNKSRDDPRNAVTFCRLALCRSALGVGMCLPRRASPIENRKGKCTSLTELKQERTNEVQTCSPGIADQYSLDMTWQSLPDMKRHINAAYLPRMVGFSFTSFLIGLTSFISPSTPIHLHVTQQ